MSFQCAIIYLAISTMRAPEFPNNLRWLNSPPLKMKDFREKAVVLIDFWTYSCVNCIRTLPHIIELHKKYADKGLKIIGVHTPEFEFEKNVENVERAIKDFGVEYPVVMDSDYQIWSLYSNNVWPRKFLINKDGQIVYDHAGEGGYRETEEAIQRALLELNPELKLPAVSEIESAAETNRVCHPTTPELYLGSMRGRPGKNWNYEGAWRVFPEYIEHERKTENFEDYIVLNFEASEVNLVMEAPAAQAAKLRLELNGKFFREIEVREAKMYNLVKPADIAHDHAKGSPRGTLKIYSREEGLRAYAFTFGGCA